MLCGFTAFILAGRTQEVLYVALAIFNATAGVIYLRQKIDLARM